MERFRIMHVIDTLAAGGAERVAVNLINSLPRDRYVPYLCTTRSDGPFDKLVDSDVIRLRLQRKSTFDYRALIDFREFLRDHDIQIVHAHSSALFVTRLAVLGLKPAIIWHAHYGRYASEDQRSLAYRMATHHIDGVITVNLDLAEWCSRRLHVPPRRIWYVPNPVCLDRPARPEAPPSTLPGEPGEQNCLRREFSLREGSPDARSGNGARNKAGSCRPFTPGWEMQ